MRQTRARTRAATIESAMDRSVLVIVLALTTLVLVMAWAYYTKREAKKGLKRRD